MYRASVERARTLRVWRRHLSLVHDDEPANCICDQQPGRFRKGQRAAGCGKPRCYLYHLGKLLKRATLHQYRSDLSYREWRAEVGFPTPRLRRPDW